MIKTSSHSSSLHDDRSCAAITEDVCTEGVFLFALPAAVSSRRGYRPRLVYLSSRPPRRLASLLLRHLRPRVSQPGLLFAVCEPFRSPGSVFLAAVLGCPKVVGGNFLGYSNICRRRRGVWLTDTECILQRAASRARLVEPPPPPPSRAFLSACLESSRQ